MMVIPVSQHKLIKIRATNRALLIKFALWSSTLACICTVIGSLTNSWIFTSEVLKYFVFPNNTQRHDYLQPNQPVYLKRATIGPHWYCWQDPVTEFHCNAVQYFSDDDPSDVTTSVQQAVRLSFVVGMSCALLDVMGVIAAAICHALPNPYASLLYSAVLHIVGGVVNFAALVMFMSAVSKEVGNKNRPESDMDDPLFYSNFGFSFMLFEVSFLLTELAALFSIIVYMAKRDERTFNRYKLRSLLNYGREGVELNETERATDSYHQHSRYSVLRQKRSLDYSRTDRPSLDAIVRGSSEDSDDPITIAEPLREAVVETFTPAFSFFGGMMSPPQTSIDKTSY